MVFTEDNNEGGEDEAANTSFEDSSQPEDAGQDDESDDQPGWMENCLDLPENMCSYDIGYVEQSVFVCLTCRDNGASHAVLCSSCAAACHEGHDVENIGAKREVRCDCGNEACFANCTSLTVGQCRLQPQKNASNPENIYTRNFDLKYCFCNRMSRSFTIVDHMLPCDCCMDWFHETCTGAGEIDLPPHLSYAYVCQNCYQECLETLPSFRAIEDEQAEADDPVWVPVLYGGFIRQDWLLEIDPEDSVALLPPLWLRSICANGCYKEFVEEFEDKIFRPKLAQVRSGELSEEEFTAWARPAAMRVSLFRRVIQEVSARDKRVAECIAAFQPSTQH